MNIKVIEDLPGMALPHKQLDLYYVDEDESLLSIFQSEAALRGYSVDCDTSIHASLQKVVEESFVPRFLLVNKLSQSEKLSGYDIIAFFQKAHPHAATKTGVITVGGELSSRMQALSLGVHYFFSKPIDIRAIFDAIEISLDEPKAHQRNILYVDADEAMCQFIQDTLPSQFFRVRCLSNTSSIFEALRENAIDLLMIDIAIKDGVKILEVIRSDFLYQALPIIVITDMVNTAQIERVYHLEIEDLIYKPISESMLKARFVNLFRKLQARQLFLDEDQVTLLVNKKGLNEKFLTLSKSLRQFVLTFLLFKTGESMKPYDSEFGSRLRAYFPVDDIVATLGDNWFCVLHPDFSYKQAEYSLKRVFKLIQQDATLIDVFFQNATGTIVSYPYHGKSVMRLFHEAKKKNLDVDPWTVSVKEIDSINFDPKEKVVGIVDGDELLLSFLKYTYEAKGHPVQAFTTGGESIQWVEESALANPPSLILLDIQLEDMNGIIVLQKLRESLGHSVPIIILSSFEQDEMIIESLQKGANDFIVKPFNIHYLLEKSKQALQ